MAEVTMLVADPSNSEQVRIWDGTEGAYWADNAEQFDRSLAAYRGPFLQAASIRHTDVVLDIGCGTGGTTRDAARAANGGSAFGVDLSARMVEVARRGAADEGLVNARFAQADAQVHPFEPHAYDIAISRTGTMFFGDPVAAFRNIGLALRSGGRIAMLTWQGFAHNEWMRAFVAALAVGRDLPMPPSDVPGPFSLSEPDRIRAILGGAGFSSIEFQAVETPMHFGDDVEAAFRLVAGLLGWMLEGLDAPARTGALDGLRTSIAGHLTGDGVLYGSAAWITRASLR